MSRRLAHVAVALAVVSFLLTACRGGGDDGWPSATHTMSDGTVMDGASMSPGSSSDPMASDQGSGGEPSETASMVCGEEIREAVAHTLTVKQVPPGVSSWHNRLFRCSYPVEAGGLRLSVKDLDSEGPGRAYFDGLRKRLPGATPVPGLQNFGFPAFETPRGDVVFIKDHKTLWVDASHLVADLLPAGMSRGDVAYGVAAAVIGCWTE